MKETGIIMSGNHPKLILDGTKTMARRVIKLKPPVNEFGREWSTPFTNDGITWVFTAGFGMATRQLRVKCPYGGIGDRLWVRETWRVGSWDEKWIQSMDDALAAGLISDKDTGVFQWKDGKSPCRWRPSIFMPRWASRITLEITDIRVERVQEINSEDAAKEGVRYASGSYELEWFTPNARERKRIEDFSTLWDSLNAKRGYGWEVNPWVWVLSFRRLI